jgi:hypothetical protein
MKQVASATLMALAIAYGAGAHAVIYDGDDGTLLRNNVSKTPLLPTEFANIQMAKFYVPAQDSLGALTTLTYTRPDTSVVFTRTQAKPLVTAFNDGTEFSPEWTNPVTGEVFDTAFAGHGKRDVFNSMSFDDGQTWKRVNLSQSGTTVVGPVFIKDHTGKYVCDTTGLSGSEVQDLLKNPVKERCDYFYYGDNPLETPDPTPLDINPLTGRYEIDGDHLVEENPNGGGDVVNVSQYVVGNHILVTWVSRVCTGGVSPLDTVEPGTNPYDIIGLQNYVDYALQKADGELGGSELQAIREIGKAPFTCVWARRGRMEADTVTGGTKVRWWPAERLTSGMRDAWKIEVAGQENAGFAVVWQEDPDGLKPGSGEGPGEGWSGSTVNHKTDVWYSFLHLKDFDTPVGTPAMSVPVPITDNAKCPLNSGDQGKQWCYVDQASYDPNTRTWTPGSNGLPDYCADGDLVYNSCIAEDGRFMEGQTGASRPRISLQSYCVGNNDPATWAATCTDPAQWSAWAGISYEESKGKGDLVDTNGATLETGKNIRWASFDFQNPEPTRQHLLLNAPTKRYPGRNWAAMTEIYNGDGVIPDTVNPMQDIYLDYIVYRPNLFGISVWSAPLFDTEIARRAAPMSQTIPGAVNSTTKTTVIGLYKQGLINQGGSADIMFRRFVLPEGFNAGTDNPFGNMACNNWATAEELGKLNNPDMPNVNGLPNPNYLDGLCLEPAHNASAYTPTRCEGATVTDPTGTACGYMTTDPFIYKPTAVVRRIYDWTQTQGGEDDPATTLVDESIDNRDDESWHNPWDVAKGHRGFLSGDFIMLQYAWSPNEYANAVGRDTYNLYVRRSFDGGQTWTTTPAALNGTDPDNNPATPAIVADGTMTCETYRAPVVGDTGVPGLTVRTPLCTTYTAGAPEPARNVSLVRTRLPLPFPYPSRTVLDPRYSPTGGLLKHASTAFVLSGTTLAPQAPYAYPAGDLRDPSKFIISYDDGDNRTVAGGAEAEPLDMYYTQASNWGDDYTGVTGTVPTGTFPILQRLNVLGTNASESSVVANPDGSFMYSIWNQWQWSDPSDYTEGTYDSEEINEDAIFRRIMFLNEE